jgi:hypothetical protein
LWLLVVVQQQDYLHDLVVDLMARLSPPPLLTAAIAHRLLLLLKTSPCAQTQRR